LGLPPSRDEEVDVEEETPEGIVEIIEQEDARRLNEARQKSAGNKV
jgi:hypothetical protein